MNDFSNVLSVDEILLALWKFFHYHPLAINFLKNPADEYEECHVTPESPKIARWTAHNRSCKSLCDGYKQILSAYSTCVSERKEPDAIGIFQEVSSKRFLAIILILHDVFAAIQSLNLVLQKDLSDLTITKINTIFVKSAVTKILSLSPGAGTCSNLQFDLSKFEEKFS